MDILKQAVTTRYANMNKYEKPVKNKKKKKSEDTDSFSERSD